MWWNKFSRVHAAYVLAAALVTIGAFLLVRPLLEHRSIARESRACEETLADQTQKIDCWLQIVFRHLRASGIGDAFTVFGYLYDTYPLFASTGCHVYAHRVGDTAYYRMFVADGLTLPQMDFPQSTTACGYGFFHGFIEHLIQDHPGEKYVVDTCEYLRKRLSRTMRDIGTICYHASGHGFMQAQLDTLGKGMWGKPVLIVNGPLLRCEDLPTNSAEKEDCREGVFNVLTEWQRAKNFGLFPDLVHPFALCAAVDTKWRQACLYELAQQVGPLTQDSPLKAEALAARIQKADERQMSFGVMVASMMQEETALDRYEVILSECVQIKEAALFKTCVQSMGNGMMEHGSPGKEYERVLAACADPLLGARGGDAFCYDALSLRLLRFYDPKKTAAICREFPETFRASCPAVSAQQGASTRSN